MPNYDPPEARYQAEPVSQDTPPPSEDSMPAKPQSGLFAPWLALGALLLFHLLVNIWWQHADNRVIRTDEEVHMKAAREYYEAFTLADGASALERLIAVARVQPGNPVHPPLLHATGALSIMILGYSPDHIALTSTLVFLLLLLGSFLIARRFLPPWQALFAVFVISFTPIIFGSSRFFMTDFLSVALVVWAVYALLRSNYFHHTGWTFVFALLNGLGILARTTTFLFYLVPCLLVIAAGYYIALRLPNRQARWAGLGRVSFNCLLVLVVTVGVFGPWYFRNIDFYYQFWMEEHLGGIGGPMAAHTAPPVLPEPVQLAVMAPDAPAVAPTAAPVRHAANVLGALDPARWLPVAAQAGVNTGSPALDRLLHPAVPWVRYVVHLINNALLLPLFVLSLLGMLCVPLLRRYRVFPVLMLLIWALSAYVLLTVLFKYSNPRYVLPAVPALSLFAAMAVMAPPWVWVRRGCMLALALLLVMQYGATTFGWFGRDFRIELPVELDPAAQRLFRDPGLVVFKTELVISDAFAPFGPPESLNFKDRLFATLVNAENQRPFLTGTYANFQRLNVRGMEFHQQHYWPEPNPYLSPRLTPEQVPSRRLRSVGYGTQPEHLLSRLGITDYVLYVAEPGQEAQEIAWQDFFIERGFELIDRFEHPRFGRVPQQTFGVLVRQVEGELVEVSSPEVIDSLALFDLYDFIYSPAFAGLDAPLQEHARNRFRALVMEHEPFFQMHPSISLVTANAHHDEDEWYEIRLLFRVTGPIDRDYRAYFNGAPLDPSLLPEDRREQGYIDWNFDPVPPTSEWRQGEYVLLKSRFNALPAPFQFTLGFFIPPDQPFGSPARLQMDLRQQ